AGLRRCDQAGHAARPLRGSDERDRLHPWRPGRFRVGDVRRREIRPQGRLGRLRQGLCRQQRQGLMNDISKNHAHRRRSLWKAPLRQPGVWRRACTLGLGTGALQVAVNQGDYWFRHAVDGAILVKSIISPAIAFSLVLISSAATWVERQDTADKETESKS